MAGLPLVRAALLKMIDEIEAALLEEEAKALDMADLEEVP
jgi:hypothetical protein